MRYTRTALGLLNAQYRSVLKKCFLINMGLFALGASVGTANAAITLAPTLDTIKTAAEQDGAVSSEAYELTKLASGETLPEGVAAVKIGDGVYYFSPKDNQDAKLLSILAGTPVATVNDISNPTSITFDVANISSKFPSSVFGYAEGTENDYNFVVQEADESGNISKKYYKVVINSDRLGTSQNISWTKLGASSMTDVVAVQLPNDKTEYYKYTYNESAGRYVHRTPQTSGTLGANIDADFVGSKAASYYGGAIYNWGGVTKDNIIGNFIDNNAQSTTNYVLGGAILNEGTISRITGDFIGNNVQSTGADAYAQGGAISNSKTIGDITGNIIGNYAKSEKAQAQGGAILNAHTIGNVTGSFIGNYVQSYKYAQGGAIYNYGTVGNLTGDFIDNFISSQSANVQGGAISNSKTIGDITGDFIGNNAQAYAEARGGAIYNESTSGNIGNITGNFIGNYAESTKSLAQGGAILNTGNAIGDITGDFINNNTKAYKAANGGAVYNNASGSLGNINGKFDNNYVKSTRDYAQGGAIFNAGTMKNMTGDFTGNYAESVYGAGYSYAQGGAIFNSGKVDIIKSNFIGNNAQANISASGGAIYNSGTINSITGDFINNYESISGNVYAYVYASGGAIYNSGTIKDIDGSFTGNYAYSSYYSASSGGAISNSGTIGNITGDFIGNYASVSNYLFGEASGGAIYNGNGIINSIIGDFIGNYASAFSGHDFSNAYGGAIYNGGTIKDIDGDFTSNYVGLSHTAFNMGRAQGGAINNEGEIDKITGKFTGNYAKAKLGERVQGGAINNERKIDSIDGDFVDNYVQSTTVGRTQGGAVNNEGEINKLHSNFSGNYAQSDMRGDVFGGAVYNGYNGVISSIDGDFKNNFASADAGLAYGGAISNEGNGKIENITGNFIDNYARSSDSSVYGGAIHNNGTMNSITGDFVGNRASSSDSSDSSYSYGGAIHNSGTMNSITGDFVGNHAYSSYSSNSYGGAIHNSDTINSIAGDFVGNYAYSYDTDAKGGAIYNLGTITFGGASEFTDNYNYIKKKGLKESNAIYNEGTINFNSGDIVLNDAVTGNGGVFNLAGQTTENSASDVITVNNQVSGNTVNLTQGLLKLGSYNSAEFGKSVGTFADDVNFVVSGGALTTQDGETNDHNLGNLQLDADLNTAMDVDLANVKADVFGGASANGEHSLILNDIKAITDTDRHILKVKVADENIKDKMTLAEASERLSTADNTYLVEYEKDATSGNLKFGNIKALETAVQFKKADKNFEMSEDAVIETDLGALKNDGLNIIGNNHTIDGAGFGGMTIANGQTVSLSDVTVKGFAGAFAENNGTLNIKSDTSTNLESAISGTGTINADGAGKLNVKTEISGNTLNLNQGVLSFERDENGNMGSFADDVNFVANGGALTTQDGETNDHNLGNLQLKENLNTAIDVDLANVKADVFGGASANGEHSLILNDIKAITDTDRHILKVKVADENIKDKMTLAEASERLSTADNTYLVEYEKDANSGNLKFGNIKALETAVQFKKADKNFEMSEDAVIETDLGALKNDGLNIIGNNHTIDGAGFGGMNIAQNQTVSLNDVTIKGFAGSFAENNGTMNISASEGNEVNLNSAVSNNGKLNLTGVGETNINSAISGNGTINAQGSGDLNVNGQIENKLTLANGTLKLGDNGSISDLIAAGGAFSAQDNAIKGYNLGKLDLQKDLNTAIDVDLNAKTGDVLTGSTTATSANDSKILIDNIKILNDGTNHIIKVKVADENIKDSMDLASNVTVDRASDGTNNYLIVYEKDATSGNLKFGQVDALETAVQFENANKAFSMGSDITTDTDLGALTGDSLSISGAGHTIDGSGFGGMNIAQNQTVSLNDVTIKGFDGSFAENNGTMNISASEGNEVNLNSAVSNNGKLNLTGVGETNINSAISGNGTINAQGSGDLNVNGQIENELTLANGTLKLGDNGSISDLIAAGGAFSAQDNAIKGYNLGKLDLQKDLNTAIDVDLNAKTGDVLTGSTTATSANDSKILIDNIKILNDGTNHIIKVKVADENLKDSMDLASNVTRIGNYLIVYEKDATSGNLKFGQVDALETAVQFENANKAFSMGSDITTDTDLGALTGDSLSISGAGHTIDGSGFGGMNIAQNQTVSLNDVTIKGFAGSFAENNGIMNINASEGNEVNLNSGISNNGKLNLTGAGETNINSAVSGNGTINADNAGTLNINSAVNAGLFNAEGKGKFNFNDTLTADKMNVSGGELNLKNGTELANVENFVANGGVLNVGDQTINLKNATFNDGSTVAINVKSDGNGLLKADSLTINGGNLKATLGQGIVDMHNQHKTVTLLESGTAFDNNFADVMENNMYRFEKAEKAGDYIISLTKTAEDVSKENGGTSNNANEAKAWVDGSKFEQGTVSADVADKLADLAQNDAQGFNNALTALAPSDAPLVRTISVNHNNQIFSAVSRQLDDSSARQKAYGLASGDSALSDGVSVWAQIMGNRIKLDDNARAYGFEVNDYGVALGIEKQVSSSVKTGIGYSYFADDADAYLRDVDVDTHTGFVYGEYRPNAWYVNAIASYGYSDYDETKHVAGSKYKAKYDVDNIGAQVMTGYNADVAKIDVTPEAGLRYNNIHRDNYVDGAGQSVKAETMDVLTAVAGVKVGKDLVSCFGTKGFYWRPEARLAATYDLISDKENAVVSLSNGSGYVVDGQRLKRFGIEAGAGVTFFLTPDVESSVGYEGKFRKDYQDHTGYISAKYKF